MNRQLFSLSKGRLVLLALGAVICLVPCLGFRETPAPPHFVPSDSCRADSRSGVSLCWNSDESIFTTSEARKYSMSATPLSNTERERSLSCVSEALRRYPTSLLKNNLGAVFVVKDLHFSGITAAGTYGADRVFLANGGQDNGYTSAWIRQTFHSEFSSVLLWRHPEMFDDAAWNACNSPGFRYSSNGVQAVKNGQASMSTGLSWWMRGFIDRYAMSSREEDFNSLVEYLFTHPASERLPLQLSPILARKAALVQKFYRKLGMNIDPPTILPTRK